MVAITICVYTLQQHTTQPLVTDCLEAREALPEEKNLVWNLGKELYQCGGKSRAKVGGITQCYTITPGGGWLWQVHMIHNPRRSQS